MRACAWAEAGRVRCGVGAASARGMVYGRSERRTVLERRTVPYRGAARRVRAGAYLHEGASTPGEALV